MSDSVRPHRRQPTRLPRPWDSPGKNAGVGCHFLLQCVKVKSENEVAQSCLTLSDPMDCSLPGSSIHGIFSGKSTGAGCHCLLRTVVSVASSRFGDSDEVQFISVAQSCPTLCDPMNHSTPGLPVHHQLLELAQAHVH